MAFVESCQLEARAAALRAFVDRNPPATPAPDQADHTFLNVIQPLRIENSRLNVELGRLAHALDDLITMLERTPHDARARSQLAEVCRQIAKDPALRKQELRRDAWKESHFDATTTEQLYWRLRAKREFEQALKEDRRIPDTRRGLGLLFADLGQPREAIEQLRAYLTLAPEADDRGAILDHIAQLELAAQRSPLPAPQTVPLAPASSPVAPMGIPDPPPQDSSRRWFWVSTRALRFK
jgi:tetratricopeptide (TPR) repeat protein